MSIQDVILGFLMDGPMSGYDIKHRFEASVSHFFDASFGGIYPALRKMERDGLISKEVVIQEGKPNKNLFHVTDLGRQAFFEYLASPSAPTVIRSDFLIRTFFARYASPQQRKEWARQELVLTEENLRELQETKERVYERLDPYERLTLDFGIAHSTFAAEWVKRLAAELATED